MARKLSAEDIAVLPADIRKEVLAAGGDADTVREFRDAPTRAPRKGERDETLVDVLVIAHTMPAGEVQVEDEEEPDVFRIEQRRLAKKSRWKMPRWCAQLMERNDQIVIL